MAEYRDTLDEIWEVKEDKDSVCIMVEATGEVVAEMVWGQGDKRKAEHICAVHNKTLCPECGNSCPDDERVKNDMKCVQCAYGGA